MGKAATTLRRAIARACVEKANHQGFPYRWDDNVEVLGLSGEVGVVADLRDGYDRYVSVERKTLPEGFCRDCGAPPGYHYHARCVYQLNELLKGGTPETAKLDGRVDVPVYWRGSVLDLVTDLKALLTMDELAELAGETAMAWREKRRCSS